MRVEATIVNKMVLNGNLDGQDADTCHALLVALWSHIEKSWSVCDGLQYGAAARIYYSLEPALAWGACTFFHT